MTLNWIAQNLLTYVTKRAIPVDARIKSNSGGMATKPAQGPFCQTLKHQRTRQIRNIKKENRELFDADKQERPARAGR